MYLLTAIGLPPGGSCTIHIYTQTIHRMTQNKQYIQHKNSENNTNILEECGPCNLAIYTLAFALQLRKKQGKTSVRVENLSHGCSPIYSGVPCTHLHLHGYGPGYGAVSLGKWLPHFKDLLLRVLDSSQDDATFLSKCWAL
jgi:hypothetical protein